MSTKKKFNCKELKQTATHHFASIKIIIYSELKILSHT